MGRYYFVGSGIASPAGAAYLICDGNVSGSDILIFKESKELGGSRMRMDRQRPVTS